MYVYDIEEEDTLSDNWAISSTNITITGLEPTYQYPSTILCSFSMVTAIVTTEASHCLDSKYQQYTPNIININLMLYRYTN